MSNIYLHTLNQNDGIPTPRLRSLLKSGTVTVTDRNVLLDEVKKGSIPFYKIPQSRLYKDEKKFLKTFSGNELYFCFPMIDQAELVNSCTINQQRIEEMFGISLGEQDAQCIKFKGQIVPARVNQFCKIYDKTFHCITSLLKVMETGQYELNITEKEIFSGAFMRLLALANIRLRLDCQQDIENITTTYPLWLQQFSRGIIILDVPNNMVANSFISQSIPFIAKAYADLKFVSLSICKRFLVKMRNHPDYPIHKDKIEDWIGVCSKLMEKTAKNKWIPFALVTGLLTAVIVLKAVSKK